ncbi:MAG: hypothetical protein IK004_07940 [Bacteroidales bacterium]|nr:hypothetical protein [Bacteroidales bacterium]
MSKIVCIYPQDDTTDFLRPLCDHICATFDAMEVGYDISGGDNQTEIIYNKIEDVKTIFFLGHGESTCLYASIINGTQLFNKDNVSLLENKQLFLLACNSDQFINTYKLSEAIGFGFLPTSIYDARHVRKLHSMRIEHLKENDIDSYNTAIVNALINTLSEETMEDSHLFAERLKFSTCEKIVNILLQKETPNYRIVADALYYFYKDVNIR